MSINLTHNENLKHLHPYSQSKNTYDRFIPNRDRMKKTYAIQAYRANPPTNPYEQALYHTLFPGRHLNEPTLALRDWKFSERQKIYHEREIPFEGNCSVHITKPCEWVGEILTVSITNCIYNCAMNNTRHSAFSLKEYDQIYAFSWNATQTHLAVAYNQNALKIWDRNVGDCYKLRKGTREVCTSQIEWKSPDLIAMGYDLEFALIDQRSHQTALQHFNFHDDHYSGFRFSKDGNRTYLTTNTGSIKTIDIRNATKLLSTKKIAANALTYFDFMNTSFKKMITTSQDGYIRIFDVEDNFNCVKKINSKKPITSFAMLNDFWITGHKNTLCYWNAKSHEKLVEHTVPGFRHLFTDPSKNRLGILTDGTDEETVNLYKY